MSSQISELRDRTLAGINELYEFYGCTLWAYHVSDKVQQHSPSSILLFHSDIGLEDSVVEDYRNRLPKFSDELQSLVFVQLLTKFEAFFFDLLKILLIQRPVRLPKKRTISYGEVVECDDLNELLGRLVAKDLNELKYQPVKDWFEKLQEIVNISPPSEQQIVRLAEMKASRDLIVHNSGIINEIYIKKVGEAARGRLGDLIAMATPYLKDSFKLLISMVETVSASIIGKLNK